jgi:hypothetical protein
MWIVYLILSVLSAFGLSVALVHKGRNWPIRRYRLWLELIILPKIHPRFPRMLNCVVCTSFWATLLMDIVICSVTRFKYFAWPLSGFVTVGITWIIMDFLNTLGQIANSINK